MAIRVSRSLKRRLRTQLFLWQGAKIGKGTCLGRIDINRANLVAWGEHCMVEDDVFFTIGGEHNTGAPAISFGSRVHIGRQTIFLCVGSIQIGNDVMIAPNCVIVDNNHGFTSRDIPMAQQVSEVAPIKIENDVWIGADCKILKGVTIRRGAIIAAGSVLTKSVGEFEIWGGVPAKQISMRPE